MKLYSAARALLVFPAFCVLLNCRRVEPPVLGRAPEFSLIAQDGSTFNTVNLRGTPWLAYFFFTSCTGPCPAINANVASLLANDALAPFHAVAISIDPAHDSPEVLHKYAVKYDADAKRWHFLTGAFDDIRRIAQDGFHLGVSSSLLHSTKIVLIDAEFNIRAMCTGTEKDCVSELSAALKSESIIAPANKNTK